uniref:Uncharacterized protein n=1 Tax=Hucho hucho TaxID=62062 RepID=A0A4W5L3N7_9TELE
MENITCRVTGRNFVKQPANLWRPWDGKADREHASLYIPYINYILAHFVFSIQTPNLMVLYSRLFWPKSRCFDYLYQDAEMLLRNYPVQATICLYEDSSSNDDEENVSDNDHLRQCQSV